LAKISHHIDDQKLYCLEIFTEKGYYFAGLWRRGGLWPYLIRLTIGKLADPNVLLPTKYIFYIYLGAQGMHVWRIKPSTSIFSSTKKVPWYQTIGSETFEPNKPQRFDASSIITYNETCLLTMVS
jgi:hypothetical protein